MLRISEPFFPTQRPTGVYPRDGGEAGVGAHDDSERVQQLEAQLEQTTRQLDLLRAELNQRSKMADLGVVAASVAHDLNNPLSAMKITAQDCLRDWERDAVDPQDQQEQLRTIIGLVDSMGRIVNEIRGFARRSQQVRAWERVDVNYEVRCSLTLLRSELERANIQVHDGLKVIPPAIGQTGKIQQVVVNLIHNAHDAFVARGSQKEPRQLWVGTAVRDAQIFVEVRDNAGGIPEDVQPRVFEAFFTTKPAGKGTGLGLAICQRIVESWCGTLKFEVEQGMGTRFVLSTPVAL